MTTRSEATPAERPLDRNVMQQSLLDIGFAHDRTTGKEDWLTPPESRSRSASGRGLNGFAAATCGATETQWSKFGRRQWRTG